jgi:serine/threonine protein kinase
MKKFFSFCLIKISILYRFLATPFWLAYYRFYFRNIYQVNILQINNQETPASFLFRLISQKSGEGYIFKKQNFFNSWYDRLFIGYCRLSDYDLYQALNNLSRKEAIAKHLPQIKLEKGKILFEYFDEKNYCLLDNFFDAGKFNQAELIVVKQELENLIIAINRSSYIHGDIKAKNIYYNQKTGRIVLIDWDGLRVLREEEKDLDKQKLEQIFTNLFQAQNKK